MNIVIVMIMMNMNDDYGAPYDYAYGESFNMNDPSV